MVKHRSVTSYPQLLQAHVQQCTSIVAEDRQVAVRKDRESKVTVLIRGGIAQNSAISYDADYARQPMQLERGGKVEIFVRIRQKGENVDIPTYRVAFLDLPQNENQITSMRFDHSDGQHRNASWDDDLQDNPFHPWAHMHINFHGSVDANSLRIPTARVCPITLLRAFDYWYRSTFTQ